MPKSYLRLLFCCAFWVFATVSNANENTLEISVGWAKPPYVFSETDSGFELDLVRLIFLHMGNKVHFVYVPYGRSYDMIKNNRVDVAMTLSPKGDIGAQAVFSESYISYRNVLISKKKNKIHIRKLHDIAKCSVVAFQTATVVLGKDFANTVQRSPLYLEMADQRKQVEMLMLDRVDVVAMDINIFKHWYRTLSQQNDLDIFDIHHFFDATHYRLGFNDPQLRDRFNIALNEFKKLPSYSSLLTKYSLEM